jgi:hypothetical protein
VSTLRRWNVDLVLIRRSFELRRMVDLMVASVLMDAGAGNTYKFAPKDGGVPLGRSEGLAVGSLEMFEQGMFSGDAAQPYRVDCASSIDSSTSQDTDVIVPALGLSKITPEQISIAMQVSPTNPMDGIEGRSGLLVRLGAVLTDPSNSAYFTSTIDGTSRPGHIVDYLLSHPTSQQVPSPNSYKIAVQIDTLWEIVVVGLSGVWPAARTKVDGISLGDVWPAACLTKGGDGEDLVSFHKLSQWLSYSLIEV